MQRKTWRSAVAVAAVAATCTLGACGGNANDGESAQSGSSATPTSNAKISGAPLEQIKSWIAEKREAPKTFHIAWLKADAKNPYTLAEQAGGLAAAKRYGAEVKVFDASFNPNTQSQQLQDALTGYDAKKYDGIVIEPVAGVVLCPRVKQAIARGVPISVDNQPLCGDDGYTKGTVGYAGVQLQRYFDRHAEYAFKSCKGKPCKAVVITGPVGFDVATKLQTSLKKLKPKYPNVDVVANQASDFSAQKGLQIMRDALTANPDIQVVISQWDDQMTGVVQAIKQAGKKPGSEVRIYSNGADKTGVKLVRSGDITETTLLMPYEEGEYAMEEMMRYLITNEKTEGTVWLPQLPLVTDGPGDIFITRDNVDKWTPEY
jgi:ribose transport system substrate-binding protein